MERAIVDGITLEYRVAGAGEPVVTIHGSFIADAFWPLLADPVLTDRYRLIAYRRRGYAGSTQIPAPGSIGEQAADCRALMLYLGIERAHVVGHSFGGCVALQLALNSPSIVHSLALLEPALMIGASAQSYRAALVQGGQRYEGAGAAVAVDEALQARCPGYREHLDRVLPGAFAQAVADAGTAFGIDHRHLLDWQFTDAEARGIAQPVLSVLGGKSEELWPRFGETHRLLLAWLPQATGFVLPNATHLLQVEQPSAMAEGLAAFFARHPLPDRT